ncbi:ParA family protein (plasmid) [Halobacterium salinarum]|jgi:chromosome partitioning protein|uniref:ParA family protein n=1 Tax=Halobacterium salinarum TaxID=2242 RepID=UPI0030CDAB9B
MSETRRAACYVGKGGVGKTTSTAHIATAAASDHGLDVVILDLAGTQNDLATQFGVTDDVEDPDAPISAVFGDDWEFIASNIPDVVDRMVYDTGEGPDLIPADAGLSGADNNLASVPVEDRYLKLDAFISEHLADRYDLVLLDLPGKEDNIALNGVFAAEHIVTPLCPGEFEQAQLENLREDLDAIRTDLAGVLDAHDVHPHLAMVIPTMISGSTNQSAEFVEEIETEFPEISGEPVAKSQNIGNLQAVGQTLLAADDDELYSTGTRAREAYRQNTNTLLDRLTPR